MAKEMLINVSAGEECRIALLENNKLEELYMERTSNTSHVGNIYKGKVTNVEPSIQAAFVDFGIGRNGFLHISDLLPQYFGKHGANAPAEKVGQKLGRRDRPPIQQCLRKGDEIVVQIIKEGIGTKGPTLSTYLSIPGRVLVMMPGMAKMGVSKKIEDETERSRLRKILDGLTPPKDCGFIIRTAGIGKTKLEIEKDLKYLARLWDQLKKQIDKDKPPVELYTEGDLITRTVRDVFTSDVDSIIVDDKETAKKIKDFIKLAMPRTKNKVELYEDVVPLFHKYELETVVEGMYSKRVPLPSGGSLIIDQTEAVVAIDVNSGKFRDHSDAETTAFKTDMEAADEIPRQLRLRDMGGVIICDFIDLRFERHRRELEDRLFENLKKDRAKTRMLRMSQFGIIEMTRQRMRPSLRRAIYHDCQACLGQGMVKTPESMALDVMRKLRIGMNDAAVARVQLTVHPDVATYLQNRKRYELAKLEQVTEKSVTIASDADLSTDETKFELYDGRDGFIYIAELGMALPSTQQNRQPQGEGRGRGRDGPRRDQQAPKPKHDRREDETRDAEDLFSDEAEAKPAGRGKAAPKSAPDEDTIEQTGNDDEASVVDVDEGGDQGPGESPGTFFEPGQGDRDRNDRGGPDRNRGRDRGRNRNRRDIVRGPDNRNADNRNGGNRDQRGPDNRGPRPDQRQPVPQRDEQGDAEAGEAEGEIEETPFIESEEPHGTTADANVDDFVHSTEHPESREGGPGQGDGSQQTGEGGRRRRRRRGRRGRGRNNGEGGQGEGGQAGDQGGGEPAADGVNPPPGRDAPQRNDEARRDQPRRDEPRRDESRRDEPRRDDRPQNDQRRPQGDRPRQDDRPPQGDRRPQQGGRDDRRGPQQGGRRDERPNNQGNNRRGSSRADLSHLAREAARQDNEGNGAAEIAEPVEAYDEDHSPGNDINFVPKAKPEPAGRGRGGRRPARGGRAQGRGNTAAKRQPPIEGLPNDEELDAEAAALEASLAKAREAETMPPRGEHALPSPIKVPNVKRTGSSDAHLVDDEQADGEDVKPPSSYTDLDALPDYEDD